MDVVLSGFVVFLLLSLLGLGFLVKIMLIFVTLLTLPPLPLLGTILWIGPPSVLVSCDWDLTASSPEIDGRSRNC